MKRQITSSLLAAVLITSLAAPVGAQFGGISVVEPEVVDPGAEPRQELRYRFVEGQTGTMAMDMIMDMATSMDGIPMDEAAGAFDMSAQLAMTVTDVYDDGSARVEQTFTSYAFGETGDPVADAQLAAMSGQLEGVTVWQVIDDRGAVLELGSEAFASLPPELRQQALDSTYSVQPFPEEAVGVGALWVAAGSMSSQGLPISMSVENEVLELTDEGAVLAIAIAADADGVTDLVDDTLAGVTATVDHFEVNGGGTIEVAFDTLIPTSQADMDVTMEMSVEAGEGDETFAYGIGLAMLMDIEVYPVE